mmetsp:Transcript_25494/g.44417  ORF Transcript_25494/g.44417 Transcript_25494/m.44417 type:complete len:342 (+) Transcript_25494:1-1026(+)
MFTVNFLSFLSYIPLLNTRLPPAASIFLKKSNSNSTLNKFVINLFGGIHHLPKPFERAHKYGFGTSLVIVNILGSASIALLLLSVYICLRLLSSCKAIKSKTEKAIVIFEKKALWNYFISSFVEYYISSAIQVRCFNYGSALEAVSSIFGVGMLAFIIAVPFLILIYARYNDHMIVSRDPKMLEARWWVLFESFKSKQLAFTYYTVFLLQRLFILTVLVMVDSPRLQVYSILFTISIKLFYTIVVSPHTKKTELFLTGTFDLSEMAIVSLTALSMYFQNDSFDQVFDISCGVVIFGAQLASFSVACITLIEGIKRMKRAKATKTLKTEVNHTMTSSFEKDV